MFDITSSEMITTNEFLFDNTYILMYDLSVNSWYNHWHKLRYSHCRFIIEVYVKNQKDSSKQDFVNQFNNTFTYLEDVFGFKNIQIFQKWQRSLSEGNHLKLYKHIQINAKKFIRRKLP